MTKDCDNLVMRDALPELAAGVIAAAEAMSVRAHLDDCESCRSELLLIQTVRDRHGAVRSVDVASIVRALPSPPRRAADVVDIASRRRARSIPMRWRAAAAALVIAGGLGVLATRGHSPATSAAAVGAPTVVATRGSDSSQPIALSAATTARVAPTTGTAGVASVAPVAPALLVAGAALDLGRTEQAQLLRDLEAYDGLLPEQPDTTAYDFTEAGL